MKCLLYLGRMKLLCNEGISLAKLLAQLWDEVSVPTQGRSGEQQYAGLGGVSRDQVLRKGSGEENESRFFTKAVRLGSASQLTSWCCVQSPDPGWG